MPDPAAPDPAVPDPAVPEIAADAVAAGGAATAAGAIPDAAVEGRGGKDRAVEARGGARIVGADAAIPDAAIPGADARAAGRSAATLPRPEDAPLARSALIQLPQPVLHPPEAGVLPSGTPRGTLRGIVIAPDPLLRAVCVPAGELTFAELRALTADLFETMYAAGGRGLAAPQIGVLRRVFVMDEGWKRGAPQPLVVIDPELRWRSRKTARGVEECLSIPGQPVEMRRAASIRLTFFDLSGVEIDLTLDGTAARIAQHELDHLNGVLIGDAPPPAAAKPAPAKPARRRPRA